jgi:signal transduction histidine kinase
MEKILMPAAQSDHQQYSLANQADAVALKGKRSPGHALGLAFVSAVAHAHGGGAGISHRPDGGAVITLTLPVSVLQAA